MSLSVPTFIYSSRFSSQGRPDSSMHDFDLERRKLLSTYVLLDQYYSLSMALLFKEKLFILRSPSCTAAVAKFVSASAGHVVTSMFELYKCSTPAASHPPLIIPTHAQQQSHASSPDFLCRSCLCARRICIWHRGRWSICCN